MGHGAFCDGSSIPQLRVVLSQVFRRGGLDLGHPVSGGSFTGEIVALVCCCGVEGWSLFAFDGSAGSAFEVKDNYVVGSLLEPGAGEIEGFLRADVPDAA